MKMRQRDANPPYVGAVPPVRLLPRDLHFQKALIELMLSSN